MLASIHGVTVTFLNSNSYRCNHCEGVKRTSFSFYTHGRKEDDKIKVNMAKIISLKYILDDKSRIIKNYLNLKDAEASLLRNKDLIYL